VALWRVGRPQRHAAARRPADLREQLLRLRRGGGVQQIGKNGAAAVIGLDRHTALAARSVRPHQRPPRALVRPIDLQQPLCCGDRRFRLYLLTQQRLGHGPCPVTQPFTLGGEPGVEGRVNTVQVLQQIAVQQRQRRRLVGRRAHDLFDIHPDNAGPERDVVPRDDQNLGACRSQTFQKSMNFLPE